MKKRSLILLLAVLFFGGCQEKERATSSVRVRMDTPEGMRNYLIEQNLPALESVRGWENEYGEGIVLRTRHYEIFTTLLDALILKQVPGFMESAYLGYQGQLPKPVNLKSKLRVYLFAERGQWEAFTENFTGGQSHIYKKITKGAYYLNGSCVAYNIGREATFSVLGHEGWHQFNSACFRYRLPSWLDEGIAMLFEKSRYEGGRFYFEPGKNGGRLGGLKVTLLKGEMISLGRLVALNPGEVLGSGNTEDVMAFYSQAYALVRFLREDGYGKRLNKFHQLLLGGLKGEWPIKGQLKQMTEDRNIPLTIGWNKFIGPMLFKHYIDEDFEAIEKEYVAFCRKIVYHVRLSK